jgi:hypothetical protein
MAVKPRRGGRGLGPVEAGTFAKGKLTAGQTTPPIPRADLPVRSIRKPSVPAETRMDGGDDVPSNETFSGPQFAIFPSNQIHGRPRQGLFRSTTQRSGRASSDVAACHQFVYFSLRPIDSRNTPCQTASQTRDRFHGLNHRRLGRLASRHRWLATVRCF